MTVQELIGGEVVSTQPKRVMREAIRIMTAQGVGALTVEHDAVLSGILSERDVIRACADGADLDTTTVDKWMTEDPDSLEPDVSVEDAAEWMLAAGYRHLPVVEGTRIMGMVSIKDVLWALTDRAGV
jgi:CBS domain-containing protein